MPKFKLNLTVLASVTVEAKDADVARRKIETMARDHTASLGMIDDEPVVVSYDIEGDMEVEEVDGQAPCYICEDEKPLPDGDGECKACHDANAGEE